MFKGAKLTLGSDVDQDTYMFSLHEISIFYRCSISKYIHIKIIKGDQSKEKELPVVHFKVPVCYLELLIF